MGKTKQAEKKFDRNVEISAPILDPEIIRAIHSQPKDQRIDVRHGGFRALLSDLNPQDSTDELTPITENHLPSYIGISCAVSGYSNYSSYGKKQASESLTTPKPDSSNSTNRLTAHKLVSTTSTKPNRSRTNSPLPVRADQPSIHHVTIDKSTINSIEDERKELTEKLTASATERRRSPSPLPPTEDGRHHGAYVGARYFPMPEPSKTVQTHIPLLGIDDDIDPSERVQEDVNKVEHKIASLYGDEFVEDWKESMSHRAKKEQHQDGSAQKHAEQQTTKKNFKDLVTLKPTPPKRASQEEAAAAAAPAMDVPTPNIKVLAGVEKQFLTRLLTDENPPMPKSPSPQPPASPVSPKIAAPMQPANHQTEASRSDQLKTQDFSRESPIVSPEPARPSTPPPPKPQDPVRVEDHDHHQTIHETMQEPIEEPPRSPMPPSQEEFIAPEPFDVAVAEAEAEVQPISEQETPATAFDVQEPRAEAGAIFAHDEPTQEALSGEPEPYAVDVPSERHFEMDLAGQLVSPDLLNDGRVSEEEPESSVAENRDENLLEISDDIHHEQEQQEFDCPGQAAKELEAGREKQSRSPSNDSLSRPESQNSQISSSTVERAPVAATGRIVDMNEEIVGECDVDIGAPTQVVKETDLIGEAPTTENQQDESSLFTAKEVITQEEADDLVSFSPEPTAETNNNIDPAVAQVKQQVQEEQKVCEEPLEREATMEKYSPELTSIQEVAAEGGAIETDTERTGESADADTDAAAAAAAASSVSGKIDGHYFLNLLEKEESFIREQVREAEQILAEHESEMDEDRLGKIHSAIGKANLLINKKCNQFKGLCKQSLNGNENEQYAVLSDDLAGFWDMISIQIADVRKSFDNL